MNFKKRKEWRGRCLERLEEKRRKEDKGDKRKKEEEEMQSEK